MNKVSESSIKYLAGLLDADGSLCLVKRPNDKLGMRMSLGQTEEGHWLLENLQEEYGCGSLSRGSNPKMLYWNINKQSELEMLLPRICKYMILKATHWARIYQAYKDNDRQFDSRKSRSSSGPFKSVKHPTWAWVAGYLDGDGHYLNKIQRGGTKGKYRAMRVGAVAHTNDVFALELLQKAFGGTIRQEKENIYRWYRNLGVSETSFALRFLPKVVKHSRLKKKKIENLIHTHRQRLSEKTPSEKL